MAPVVQPDTISSLPSFSYHLQPKETFVASRDTLFFRKENYKAIVRDVRHDGTPFAYSLAQQDWLTALMLVQFFVYAFLLIRYGRVWFERIKNVWKIKEYSGLYINLSEKHVQESFPCLLMASVNLGLFAYLSLSRDMLSLDSQNWVVGLYLLLTVLFLGAKLLLTEFVASVFFPQEIIALLRSEIFSLFSYLGLLMYALLLFMLYAPGALHVIFWIGLAFILLYLLLKLYKIFQVFYAGFSTFFYLFLYLCTLEILPVLLLYLGMLFVRG